MQASRLPDAIVSSTEATCDGANALAAPPAGRMLRRRRCASAALLETAATGSGRTNVAINCSDGKGGGGSRSPLAKRRRASETRSGGDTLVRGRRRLADRVQPDEWQQRREKSSNGAGVGRSDNPQQSPRAATAPTIVITPAKERTRQVLAAAAAAAIARTTAATPLSRADGDLLKPPTVSLDDGNLAVILRRSAAVAAGATAIGCLQPEQLFDQARRLIAVALDRASSDTASERQANDGPHC